jgi:hypothetical protein
MTYGKLSFYEKVADLLSSYTGVRVIFDAENYDYCVTDGEIIVKIASVRDDLSQTLMDINLYACGFKDES